jgi:O-Antigen ligase.
LYEYGTESGNNMNRVSTRKAYVSESIISDKTRMFSLSEFIFYLALILDIGYSVFYPVYVALHDYFTYIIWAMLILMLACGKTVRFSGLKLLGLAAFIGVNIAAILVNGSGIGVIIQFIWPLYIIYMFKNFHIPDAYIGRINVLMMAGWILAIIGSLTYTDAYFEAFEKNMDTEGINPNTIAIIIVITCLFLGMYIDSKSKSRFWKILVYLSSFAALYRTRSRTSLVAFVAILTVELILKKKIEKSRKLALLLVAIIIAAGIIFPLIYVGLYANGVVTYDTLFLEKRFFTGRQYIWINLWNYLQNNHDAFIWGVGYNTELYSRGSFNLHNAYLMIFAQYGFATLLVYLAYIFYSASSMYGRSGRISNLQFKCYQILLYVLIAGFGETVLSYIPNLIFIAMAIGIGCREQLEVT